MRPLEAQTERRCVGGVFSQLLDAISHLHPLVNDVGRVFGRLDIVEAIVNHLRRRRCVNLDIGIAKTQKSEMPEIPLNVSTYSFAIQAMSR